MILLTTYSFPLVFILFTVFSQVQVSSLNVKPEHEVIFSWNKINFQFPDKANKPPYGDFIPENNVIVGIKIFKNRIFLSLPRFWSGVPATLTYLDRNTATRRNPSLIPYPSWEMQIVGNCTAFQNIQSMEIDQFQRIWILDGGRVNIWSEKPDSTCPPKLVIMDLITDKVLHSHTFPPEVVSPSRNFLNDIVVGCLSWTNCWAYITDTGDAKLVVYTLQKDKSWFVQHDSMKPEEGAEVIPILGKNYTLSAAVNGIALSPRRTNFNRIYYRPFSGFHLYSVSSSVLQRSNNEDVLSSIDVFNHGRISSQGGGMMMDSEGKLFFVLVANNSAVYTNTKAFDNPRNVEQVEVMQDDVDLEWPDCFAFDHNGYLYLTTNRLNRVVSKEVNFSEENFRVVRIKTGSRSYIYL